MIVVETIEGNVRVRDLSGDAPKTVAHIVELVKRRLLRRPAVPSGGARVSWCSGAIRDSRDLAQEAEWGTRPGRLERQPIGAAEIAKKRTHTKGAVGVAHPGNPALADSQIYVTLETGPISTGDYTVFGHVVAGDDVPARLERGDMITEDVREGVTGANSGGPTLGRSASSG